MNVGPGEVARVDTRLFYTGPEDEEGATLMQQLGAAYNLDSPEWNAGRWAGEQLIEPEAEAGFSVFDHLTPEEQLHGDEYTHANSKAELNFIRAKRQREGEWERALGEGPLNPLVASSLALIGSPSTWLSFGVGAAIKAPTIAGRMARVGAVAAAETAAGEMVLQGAQETRGWEESAAAIMMGGAFGFGLGAVGARVGSKAADDAYQAATEDMVTLMRAEGAEANGSSVGAAQVQNFHPDDTNLAGSLGVAKALSKLPRFLQAPSLQLMQSTSAVVREGALRLVDIGMITKGALKGVAMPQPVDIAIRSRAYELEFGLNRGLRRAFAEYRKGGGKLGQQEFYELVGRDIRNERSGNPAALKAAREIRDGIFDKLSAEAKAKLPEFKLIPEKNGWRYLTRAYRRDKIAADLPGWKRTVGDYFMRTGQAADKADAEEMAEQIASTIFGQPMNRPHVIMAPPSKRGPAKERVFDIPDEVIEPWLESNVMDVAGRYVRSLSADLEMARAFPDVKNPMDPMLDWAPKIRDEALAAAEKAEPGKRKAIIDKADKEIEVLAELVNRVRGIQPPPVKGSVPAATALKIGRDLSVMRALGSVVISSLNDVARIQMVEGFGRVYGTLLADMARGFKGVRMGVRQAQRIGDAVDLELNIRSRALFDVDATREGQTWLDKASRFTGRAASEFIKFTGIPHWNTFWKGVASTVASTRILRTAERLAAGKDISKFDRLRMAQSGLTEADMRAFAAEAQHWQKVGGNRLSGMENWANQEAARKLRLALVRDIDDAVITPGAGDAPLWTGTDLGKTVFQFKRFGMASTQRTLIAGLQRWDAATAGAFASMVGLGAMAAMLKDIVNKGEVRDFDPSLIVDAVDRSGVLSLFFELDGLMRAGIGQSPATALAGRQVSRFAGHGPISQAAGPTAGWFEDLGKATAGLISGDFTQPDLHRWRRLAPFQNHFALSYILSQLEEGAGLPEKQK